MNNAVTAVLVRHDDHRWLADCFDRWADPQERARAAAFRYQHHRDDYRICRTALRLLLSGVIGRHPAGVSICTAPNGKPRLGAGGDGCPPIGFSLSRSSGSSLIVIAPQSDVGADLEGANAALDWAALAPLFTTPAEAAGMAAAFGGTDAGLLRCWVLKEAAVKLNGDGLLRDPRDTLIQMDGDVCTAIATNPDRRTAHIRLFGAPGDLVAAIALPAEQAARLAAIDIANLSAADTRRYAAAAGF